VFFIEMDAVDDTFMKWLDESRINNYNSRKTPLWKMLKPKDASEDELSKYTEEEKDAYSRRASVTHQKMQSGTIAVPEDYIVNQIHFLYHD
jgi:hypothetical protein